MGTKKNTTAGLLTQATELAPIEPVKPLVDTSTATVPQGMSLSSGPTVNTMGQTYTPTAYTQQVDQSKTTQGLLSKVLDSGSELMRQAEHRGQASATRRGLGNSSIAAQASMGSMIDAALPIAQADAQLHQNQDLTNQQAMNTAAGVSNQFMSDDMKMRQEERLTELKTAMQNAAVDNEFRNRVIGQYMDGVNNILNNPDMSTEQKNATIENLYGNLKGTIKLQGVTTGMDLGRYKPGGTGTGTGTGSGSGSGSGSGGAAGDINWNNIDGLPNLKPVGDKATLTEQLDYVTRGSGISQKDAVKAVSLGAPLVSGKKQIVGLSESVDPVSGEKSAGAIYIDNKGIEWVYPLGGNSSMWGGVRGTLLQQNGGFIKRSEVPWMAWKR